jgi:hypothetical protein
MQQSNNKMAYTFYEYLILIGENSDFNLNKLAEKLNGFYANKKEIQIKISDNSVQVVYDKKYKFRLHLNEEEYVKIESEEMAETAEKNKTEIAACRKRLEMSGDADPDMDHFNDSLFILQTLESFSDVYLYSPHEGFLTDWEVEES